MLVNAVNERAAQQVEAHAWLEAALGGGEPVGIAWNVALAYLRLTTNPSIFAEPKPAEEAAGDLEGWLNEPHVVVIEPTRRHLPLLRGLLSSTGTAGKLVNDAHLAALALEHDATVVSFDRDFGRFEGVRWRLPGVG